MRHVRVEDAERTIGSIHVQPEIVLSTEVGQLVERINGARIDSPGTGHHAEWSKTCFAVIADCLAQSMYIHFVQLIDRDDARLTQSQQVRRFSETAMPLL